MDQRPHDAYVEHGRALARAGVIDDSLTEGDDARSYEERIVDVLRAAGKLRAGWDEEQAADSLPARLSAASP